MTAEKPNLLCIVEGCTRSRYGRMDICEAHNYRLRRYGDVNGGKFQQAGRRGDFWSKIDKDGPVPEHAPELGKCWVWKGAVNKSDPEKGPYGQTYLNGDRPLVHRVIYERMVGPIPGGYEVVDHLCRNTLCVNPDHLEAVTQLENLHRRVWKKDQVNA